MPLGSSSPLWRRSANQTWAGEGGQLRRRAGRAWRTGARAWAGRRGLEVTLAVQRRGEGHVVQSTWHGVGAGVGGHSRDAVLSLVRRQLTAQLVHSDVVLRRERGQDGGSGRPQSKAAAKARGRKPHS